MAKIELTDFDPSIQLKFCKAQVIERIYDRLTSGINPDFRALKELRILLDSLNATELP